MYSYVDMYHFCCCEKWTITGEQTLVMMYFQTQQPNRKTRLSQSHAQGVWHFSLPDADNFASEEPTQHHPHPRRPPHPLKRKAPVAPTLYSGLRTSLRKLVGRHLPNVRGDWVARVLISMPGSGAACEALREAIAARECMRAR